MDVSKISQQQINANIADAKKRLAGHEDGWNEALAQWDYNGDGQTSAIEMYENESSVFASVFEGHPEYAERAEQLALQRGELYLKYAGDDGIMDAYEYAAALGSEEDDVILAEYWEMKNEVEALNGETDIKGLSRYDSDGNRDGQTSAVEIYKSKAELNEQKYGDNPDIQAKADEISMRQAEILNKFAGEDGVLTSKEYAAGVQSDEYQETMREYSALLDFYNWIFNK